MFSLIYLSISWKFFQLDYVIILLLLVLLHLDHFATKDATFYKSNAGEIRFQWASQPDTLIPLSEVLGRKPRKLLLFGLSIALEGLMWRPNSQRKQSIYPQWFNLKSPSCAKIKDMHPSFLISARLTTSVHLVIVLFLVMLQQSRRVQVLGKRGRINTTLTST